MAATLLTAALVSSACVDTPSGISHETMHQASQVKASTVATTAAADLAESVRSVTARFHSTVQATKAGYVSTVQCVEVPPLGGGMGVHWVNRALVDDVFDPMQPENILYAPDKHGKAKLVAVEYVVLNRGQPAPTFGGQKFDVGGTPNPAPHWSLHVWVHKDNPSGMFAPFNPNVTCAS